MSSLMIRLKWTFGDKMYLLFKYFDWPRSASFGGFSSLSRSTAAGPGSFGTNNFTHGNYIFK